MIFLYLDVATKKTHTKRNQFSGFIFMVAKRYGTRKHLAVITTILESNYFCQSNVWMFNKWLNYILWN
jgi:hypothetical protein